MKSTKFNRSEIMSQAWAMFRNKFYGYTFSQALTMAWYYAKQEAARKEAIEARKAAEATASTCKVATKKDDFYSRFNRRNNAAYRNVRFGRNDWAVDYRRY